MLVEATYHNYGSCHCVEGCLCGLRPVVAVNAILCETRRVFGSSLNVPEQCVDADSARFHSLYVLYTNVVVFFQKYERQTALSLIPVNSLEILAKIREAEEALSTHVRMPLSLCSTFC